MSELDYIGILTLEQLLIIQKALFDNTPLARDASKEKRQQHTNAIKIVCRLIKEISCN
jgi:hypothetical protein